MNSVVLMYSGNVFHGLDEFKSNRSGFFESSPISDGHWIPPRADLPLRHSAVHQRDVSGGSEAVGRRREEARSGYYRADFAAFAELQ